MKAENTFFKSSKVSTRLISLRMDAECGYPAVYQMCIRDSLFGFQKSFSFFGLSCLQSIVNNLSCFLLCTSNLCLDVYKRQLVQS